MNKKTIAAWKVAAAIMLNEAYPIHYLALTQKVIETRLTALGINGKTPEATLNKFLNNLPDTFERVDSGIFRLKKNYNLEQSIHQIAEELKNVSFSSSSDFEIRLINEENDYSEGSKRKRLSSYYERNPKLREQAIRIHGTKCMVKSCRFDFYKTYGELGKDFIEVHHLIPISSFNQNHFVNPELDLVVVCPNCHRMLHRKGNNPISLAELEKLMANK